MEVKKIIVFIIIVILLFSSCVFGDITQYKQIGDTEYYLVESTGNVPYVNIHYYKYKDGFGESVKYKGFAKDIYWNDEFIIVKCTNRDSRIIINNIQGITHMHLGKFMSMQQKKILKKQKGNMVLKKKR